MKQKTLISIVNYLGVGMLSLMFVMSGCDFGARRDLRRAEKALKAAEKLNAEFWAEREYRKAQKAFDEATDLERERKINEARDKAVVAFDWAEEASMWAKIRAEEMEKERDALGAYKP